jgi:formylglycine-generating enzyme required for sulfatase activity
MAAGIALAVFLIASAASSETMVRVGPGTWRPFYPMPESAAALKQKSSILPKEEKIVAFEMNARPVTNQQYLDFLRKNPHWQRGKISELFVDQNYLSHWSKPLKLGSKAQPNQPVTFVSWFAAKAYCEEHGARLPLEKEWEFAAAASEIKPDAQGNTVWRQRILNWYSKPNPEVLQEVGKGPRNYWGLYDMHGLVWEWVLDFNSTMFSVDNRAEGSKNRFTFCGSGSQLATDKEDYASFMRFAFRSSLKATYTTNNLGFRCVK